MILARRLHQSEGNLRRHRLGAEDRRVHARQRHLRHGDEGRHRRGDAEVRHALQDRRDDRLRSGGARPVGRGRQGQGDRRRGAADGQPPQRRHPAHPRNGQAALVADGDPQHGPGLVRGPVSQDARQAVGRAAQLRALVRSRTRSCRKQLEAALAKTYPGVNLNTNHVYTFEALLVAADAYKRAGSADPKALADAIRKTNITDNVSPGPGIQFNAKGQNDKLQDLRDPEPRRQAGHGGAQGRGQRQGGMAAARPTTSAPDEARSRQEVSWPGSSRPSRFERHSLASLARSPGQARR